MINCYWRQPENYSPEVQYAEDNYTDNHLHKHSHLQFVKSNATRLLSSSLGLWQRLMLNDSPATYKDMVTFSIDESSQFNPKVLKTNSPS